MKCTLNLTLLVLLANLACFFDCSADDLDVGHFGSAGYGDWKITGTAFNSGPVAGDRLAKLGVENARGNQVVSSKIGGDGETGTLTSPEFKIARNYISFRISGGDYEHDTCVNLLINGKIVKSA